MPPDKKPPVPGSGNTGSPLRDEKLDQRLESLKGRLDTAYEHKKPEETDPDSAENLHQRAGIAQAFRLSSEFIAGVVVGAGIGYAIDTFFGTTPWGMIIFLMLGFVVAVLNVMRAAGMVAESSMRLKPAHELQKKLQEQVNDEGSQK